jgi:hypothetical protein
VKIEYPSLREELITIWKREGTGPSTKYVASYVYRSANNTPVKLEAPALRKKTDNDHQRLSSFRQKSSFTTTRLRHLTSDSSSIKLPVRCLTDQANRGLRGETYQGIVAVIRVGRSNLFGLAIYAVQDATAALSLRNIVKCER